MRLDHLLSKETGEVGSCIVCFLILSQANLATDAGEGLPAQGGGKANSFGESRIMSKRKAAKRRFCEVAQSNKSIFLVAMRPGDTPVLIPNTTVKTRAADGTMLETAWESRRPPDFRAYSSAG